MAAITIANPSNGGSYTVTTTSSATVDTWLQTPKWAQFAQVWFTATAITTSTQLSVIAVDPSLLDDSNITLLKEVAAFTAITGTTNTYQIDIGPGVTGIADDSTMAAAADSYASFNCILPPFLGIRQANTGASTYRLSVVFR